MNSKEHDHRELLPKPLLIVLLIISIVTNVVLIVRLNFPEVASRIETALLPAPKVLPTDHVRGNPTAKYTVIEYADFQCPYCVKFNEAMTTVMKDADVRWVYRHFPLPMHPFAEKAAEASECAADQGKFWEYSDALFALKGKMSNESFTRIARELDLNAVMFGFCLNNGKYKAAVAAQRESGVKLKIDATPTFYLNGKRYNGFVPVDEFRKLLGLKGAS